MSYKSNPTYFTGGWKLFVHFQATPGPAFTQERAHVGEEASTTQLAFPEFESSHRHGGHFATASMFA